MFRCQQCQRQQPPRIATQTNVLETRPKEYPARSGTNDHGGKGTEIVREKKVCGACFVVHVPPKAEEPEQQAAA